MMSSHEEIVEDAGSIRFSTLDEIVIESRRSSLPIEESAEEQTRSRRLRKFIGEWKIFKNIVFLIFLSFLIIQSVEFYYIYRKYPSNVIQESTVYDDFKVSAVTICFRHTSIIGIFVKNTKVTLIRHVPLYGSGEFFNRIGGLLGCWLGISIFSFSNIIETFFHRAADFKRRLSTITMKSVGAKNVQEAPTSQNLN